MPESIFGPPLQHLLPCPQANAGGNSEASDPSVQLAPLPFKDFRFNSIGKQPELLNRISLSQSDNTEYHSPTPSPISTPPLTSTIHSQPNSSSRPTLFQQLAGNDFGAVAGGWNTSLSQSNTSLASRIQMSGNLPNPSANVHGIASRLPSPPARASAVRRATEDASLIPPVEVLPQLPDSLPPTPTSWAPALEPADMHSTVSSTLLMNTTTITTSEIRPPPTVTTNTVSREPPLPSLTVVDAVVRDLQPSPSTIAAIDSLVATQERLKSISAKLASLASPLPPPPSQSPPLDPFPVTRASADNPPIRPNHPQHSPEPIELHYPYSTIHSAGQGGLSISDAQMHPDDSAPSLFPSPTTLTQEYQAHGRAIAAAIQNLNSVFNAAHVDNEKAFAHRIRTLEEQRVAFEKRKQTEEDTLRRESQELQKKREELDAKQAQLASLEREIKTREEVRKVVQAKRQAQEEEKRAAEAKRVQELQEQIADAMNELKEIKALKAKCEVNPLPSVIAPGDLPTNPQEGMNEEEKSIIKTRNDLLYAVEHLRRMHTDKVQKLGETNRTLRGLGEERKKREAEEAEEAERRRVVEEERLRAHAEMERARQLMGERQRQLEAERKRQEVKHDREQARLLVEQQAHAESLVHGLERIGGQISEHANRSEKVGASQQQGIADSSRIRAPREDNPPSQETSMAMNVDEDGRTLALHHIVSSSDIHSSPRASQSKAQKDKPISGGIILATPIPKATSGHHLPPKPSVTSLPVSSNHIVENVRNPPRTPIPGSTDRSSFPAQIASGFSGDIRSTPDHRPPFSRTQKSQTILDGSSGGSQELNIGPLTSLSPTQQNVNLRHLKRFRGSVEGSDSGDRSVRTIQVKSEENSCPAPKNEEHDNEVLQSSLSTNPPASLPPRPAVIPPPRPRMFKKRPEVPASQTDSYPPKGKQLSSTRDAVVTNDEQPREALPQDTSSSQAMNVPVPPAPAETTNSPVLAPVYTESRASEPRPNPGERPTRDRGESYDTAPSAPVSATSSHETDGEDPPMSNRRFNEHRRARKRNGSRRVSDHYSPPRPTLPSPTQPHHLVDSWRPQSSSNGPRAEAMRTTSPTAGRKRPSEFNDNEHGHRARRQRSGDVWIAPDHDRDRVDSYRPHRDRHLDSEPEEHRASYRPPTSPLDRVRTSDAPSPTWTYYNATAEPAAPAARLEQPSIRTEKDAYRRPSAPDHNVMTDEYHTNDARVGQTYDPIKEERMDSQPDSSLLARMQDTQRIPVIIVRDCLETSSDV